jgi:ribosomal protein S21
MEILVKDNLEEAIVRFKKLIDKSGLIGEIKFHAAFKRPAEKKRDKHRRALRYLKKMQARRDERV